MTTNETSNVTFTSGKTVVRFTSTRDESGKVCHMITRGIVKRPIGARAMLNEQTRLLAKGYKPGAA